ncbi:MFS transporter [Hamadaea tsunoensis]|uniref:MFS transporter n=1 Tax=Hamadaea tsunoensis TaxID=53368 RepID=UPI000410AD9E|nr:MFS transporter [Hamadaea tsunoensis]
MPLLPPPGTARVLVTATLVNTVGNGAYLATSVLFLTRVIGLTPAQVALGLSAAAAVSIVLSTPLGYLADRAGPKGMYIGALLVSAAGFAGLTLIDGFWSYAVLTCLVGAADAAARSASGAMVAAAAAPGERVRLRAYTRSANNLGIGLGTLAAAVPLALDTRAGYVVLLLADAVSFVIAAAIVARAGRVAPVAAPATGPRLVALRDRPFLVFAAIDGLLSALYNAMFVVGLPLWLVARGGAPLWLVSASLVVNTAGCVLLQVRASRGIEGPAAAARASRRGALVVAASCVLLGLIGVLPVAGVIVAVLAAAVVHVLGELLLSSATWAVVFELAPDWAQGQYQGTWLTGRQLGNMVAPPLVTALVLGLGGFGWIATGLVFAGAALAYPAVVAWGVRTRPRAAAAEPVTV